MCQLSGDGFTKVGTLTLAKPVKRNESLPAGSEAERDLHPTIVVVSQMSTCGTIWQLKYGDRCELSFNVDIQNHEILVLHL